MRTTSAVMTSPGRISVRVRDSSNRAANDSDIDFPHPQTGLTKALLHSFERLKAAVGCGVTAVKL
jgi:hypothetical protein